MKRSKKEARKASKKKNNKRFSFSHKSKDDFKLLDPNYDGRKFRNEDGGDRFLKKGVRPSAVVEVRQNFFKGKRIKKFRSDLKKMFR